MTGTTAGTALLGVAAIASSGVLLAALPASAASHDPQTHTIQQGTVPDGQTVNEISLRLDDGGVLHAQERITFGGGGPAEFTRTFELREPYDTDHDRLYEVTDLTAQSGDGRPVEITVDEGAATMDARLDVAGAEVVIVDYRVEGTVSEVGNRLELEWTAVGGYSDFVEETTVVVDAPAPPQALSCAAGEPFSSIYCTSSDMGGPQALVARFLQTDLDVGQSLDIVVSYPRGSAPSTLILDRTWSLTSAFAITPATAGVFGLLLVVLVGGLVLLIWVRGRDERALRSEARKADHAPVEPGVGGNLRFHPPDNVHPGQIGTLIDEQADVVDITATVVDLAVRGYLRIEELPHARHASVDWLLTRTGQRGEDALLPYERLLLGALFQRGDRVRLSELGEGFADRLAEVREELYRDMVRLKWFARRPNRERNQWTTVGIALTLLGGVVTVLLAVFTHAAFTGLALVLAGAAVTVGAQYVPAKTKLGSAVFAHVAGFRAYLLRARVNDIPSDRRVHLFSRYLPYAIIFDNVEHWARILAAAGAEESHGRGLFWYHGPQDWDLDDFADSIKAFTLTLSGVISNTRQFRALG
ncbi:DUF2207 domain-containing protein [Thermobifida halotolerans]|uniref:DUF2207 domain-containing protein n=2 Tax=Thermobifida halotolerans TaxID=483545 RepID=A0AA97LVI4_9ACTN|nr:DUF2207 domain-containing protein [Thermobifida halotolerans]UOE18750.1 DUF2207 domain-containing protein [Thermobifida halotolerans]